jgi:hypoxanthine phosphoribosyltransferase
MPIKTIPEILRERIKISEMDVITKENHIGKIIVSEEEIKSKIAEAGSAISEKYRGKPLLLVSILKGAFIFLADLCRAIDVPCEIGFMCAKSYYNGTDSSGIVNITMDLEQDLSRYHVIIVEDIIDTGRTLADIKKLLAARDPLSLEVVTLLDKPERRVVPLETDMSLFTVPDVFLVGYGLDCAEQFRNLPYIAEYESG